MGPVVTWAIGIGSFIFGLGMISAVASRKQRQKSRPIQSVATEHAAYSTGKKDDSTGGMSMAAAGTGNLRVREDDLASISGNSR